MEFLGGALPNVMFIIGILAIGLGLGIELKLVALNKEIDRIGRIGAIVVGVLLVAASLFIYLNPALTNRNQATSATANAALASAPANSAPAQLAATAAPAVAAVAVPLEAATATLVPTAVPPLATVIPSVLVPDLHGLDDKGAQRKLNDAGLVPKKTEKCSGIDHGEQNTRKGRVQCQNPAANQPATPGSTVEYVLAGK
jgi:PASTA domain-containing protein